MSKEVNYTDEMVAEMLARYNELPTRETVNDIAEDFGKSPRSVIAKLVNEGVYIAEPRKAKDGSPIIRKEQLVEKIEAALGLEAPSLVKASKQELRKVAEVIEKLVA